MVKWGFRVSACKTTWYTDLQRSTGDMPIRPGGGITMLRSLSSCHQHIHADAWLRSVVAIALLLSWALAGCDTSLTNNTNQQDPRSTLGSNVTDNTVGDELIAPATTNQNDEKASVTILAKTAQFCCNALEIKFETEATGSAAKAQIYAWDFGDGQFGSGPTSIHTYKWQGSYDVVLNVALSDGTQLTSQMTIILPLGSDRNTAVGPVLPDAPSVIEPAENDSPTDVSLVADAGLNQQVTAGALVQLDGSRSQYSANKSLTYAWRETTNLGVTLDNPTSATTTFTAPSPTLTNGSVLITFELTVSADTLSSTDSVTIEVLPLVSNNESSHVEIEFLTGPKGDTTAGTYEVSWRFSSATQMTNVYLSRDCCECQNVDGSALTPDANGVYTASVDIPADRTVWYFVRYTHGGIEYTSRSVHINTAPGDPTASPPMVIWYHLWRFDLDILADVLASGVVTHVMIDGGDRLGAYNEEASVKEAITMCQAKGVYTIWSMNLWNHFNDLPSLADTVDPNAYIAAMQQINAEADALGADFSAMDCEAYLGVPFDKLFEDVLTQAHFDAMNTAITTAASQVQVDFVYPAGAPYAPLFVNNVYRPLGRKRIAESTYYDSPFKICRIDFPFDIFGAYIQPTTERPFKAENPFFLPQDVLSRRYYWSKADGALGNTNGIWLYTGTFEADARATAKLLLEFANTP